ncbi:MAG: polyhydroxyalkanoate synthesis regulator DNA-binding domain-containing protein [Acidobacteriota bacterium]|nr:polyhydroxyalkanoate synthesis regulator DNA-binding domain-containing protein [Acidobacteriota bacterium]
MRKIRRYESRKLYDPAESRYVALQEIATWIREGEEIEVIDTTTGADVTGSTLTQIILEEGRSGRGRVPADVLHDLVRASGERLSSGVRDVQETANRFMRASLERLGPIREAREEIASLKERLARLEATLSQVERTAVDSAESEQASR